MCTVGGAETGEREMPIELDVVKAAESYLVVTRDALITIERVSSDKKDRAMGMLAGAATGGLGGAVLGGSLSGGSGLNPLATGLRGIGKAIAPLAEMREVTAFLAAEAPDELACHLAWPKVEGYRAIVIYPRSTIRSVETSLWTGMTLNLGSAEPVTISLGPLNVNRARKTLAIFGYSPS